MDIRVSGHQVDTGEALKTHVTDRLQGIADKYFSRAISAHSPSARVRTITVSPAISSRM